MKEIRYFYERVTYPDENLIDRFFGDDWHNEDYRHRAAEFILSSLRHPLQTLRFPNRVGWYLRFLIGRRSDSWFEALFDTSDGKLTGDFSPETFHVPQPEIARIAREWPDLKVILMLREPVAWTWSFARMSLIKNREMERVPEDEVLAFFREYAGYYPTLSRIEAWEAEFGNRLGVFFFDDLINNPDYLLSQVCDFLGLSRMRLHDLPGRLERRNPGRDLPLAPHFRRYLTDLYKEDVRHLSARYGMHPRRWLERYIKEAEGAKQD